MSGDSRSRGIALLVGKAGESMERAAPACLSKLLNGKGIHFFLSHDGTSNAGVVGML